MEIINRIAKPKALLLMLKSYYRLLAKEPSTEKAHEQTSLVERTVFPSTAQNLNFRLSLSHGLDHSDQNCRARIKTLCCSVYQAKEASAKRLADNNRDWREAFR